MIAEALKRVQEANNYSLKVLRPNRAKFERVSVKADTGKFFIADHTAIYKDLCEEACETCWQSITASISEETFNIGADCSCVEHLSSQELTIDLLGYTSAKIINKKANAQAKLLKARSEGMFIHFEYVDPLGNRLVGTGTVSQPIFGNIIVKSTLTFGYTIKTKDFRIIPCGTPCITSYELKPVNTFSGSLNNPKIYGIKVLSNKGLDIIKMTVDNQIITSLPTQSPDYSNLVCGTASHFTFQDSIQAEDSACLKLGDNCAMFTPCQIRLDFPPSSYESMSDYATAFTLIGNTDDGQQFSLGALIADNPQAGETSVIPVDLSLASLSNLDDDLYCAIRAGQ